MKHIPVDHKKLLWQATSGVHHLHSLGIGESIICALLVNLDYISSSSPLPPLFHLLSTQRHQATECSSFPETREKWRSDMFDI